MDQLAEMRVFVRVMDRGSFAVAARDLGLTPSAVSKLMTRLEARLGVRLLNRTTRQLSLTAEGELYLESGRRLIETFDALENEVSAYGEKPHGLVRVNTSFPFGLYQLAPAIIDFRRAYPDIEVDLSISDRIVDLIAEQVDVAIRTGEQRDSTMLVRKIGETRRLICASPRYLAERGMPSSPADLRNHDCIVFTGLADAERWPFVTPDGEVERVPVRAALRTDSAVCALELALAGVGLLRLGELLVSQSVRDGRLVPVLTDCSASEPWPVSAVFPPGVQKAPRVRVFLDFVVERFGREPWRL